MPRRSTVALGDGPCGFDLGVRSGGGQRNRRRADQGRSVPAIRGDGHPQLDCRRLRPAADRIADAASGGRVGARSADALGPGERRARAERHHQPRLVDRSFLDRDDRAAVHADHRLPARVVSRALLAAHRHAGRRRGEVEGRFREVPRQAARRHRDERTSRSGRHRLPARSEAADRRGAQETGRPGRSGRGRLSRARRSRSGTRKTSS